MAKIDPGYVHGQTMQCANHLVAAQGFDCNEQQPATFFKVVDDQHALMVNVNPSDYQSKPDAAHRWSLTFGIARRDINERLSVWRDDPPVHGEPWVFATLFEYLGDVFVTGQAMEWSADVPFGHRRDEIDAALDQLASWANLEAIESQLVRTDANNRYEFTLAVNDALNGRDEHRERYIGLRDSLKNGDSLRGQRRIARFDQHLETFRSAHPNGIDRAY